MPVKPPLQARLPAWKLGEPAAAGVAHAPAVPCQTAAPACRTDASPSSSGQTAAGLHLLLQRPLHAAHPRQVPKGRASLLLHLALAAAACAAWAAVAAPRLPPSQLPQSLQHVASRQAPRPCCGFSSSPWPHSPSAGPGGSSCSAVSGLLLLLLPLLLLQALQALCLAPLHAPLPLLQCLCSKGKGWCMETASRRMWAAAVGSASSHRQAVQKRQKVE